jgi:hypothetical protein
LIYLNIRAGPEAGQAGPQPRASKLIGPLFFFFKPIILNIEQIVFADKLLHEIQLGTVDGALSLLHADVGLSPLSGSFLFPFTKRTEI